MSSPLAPSWGKTDTSGSGYYFYYLTGCYWTYSPSCINGFFHPNLWFSFLYFEILIFFFKDTLVWNYWIPRLRRFGLFFFLNLWDKGNTSVRCSIYSLNHIFPIYNGFTNLVRKVEAIPWDIRRKVEVRQGNFKRNKELGQGWVWRREPFHKYSFMLRVNHTCTQLTLRSFRCPVKFSMLTLKSWVLWEWLAMP